MKHSLSIALLLSSVFTLSSCNWYKKISDFTGLTPVKFYTEIGGKGSRSVNLDCPGYMNEYTYEEILKHIDELDSPNFDINLAKNSSGDQYNFYATTFYVKNNSKVTLHYTAKFYFKKATSSLVDYFRFMVFVNPVSSGDHLYYVYAKKDKVGHYDENGELDYRPLISTPEYGYAECFQDDKTICQFHFGDLRSEEYWRFTVVYWFEGYDEDCQNLSSPTEGTIKIGYEDEYYEE